MAAPLALVLFDEAQPLWVSSHGSFRPQCLPLAQGQVYSGEMHAWRRLSKRPL